MANAMETHKWNQYLETTIEQFEVGWKGVHDLGGNSPPRSASNSEKYYANFSVLKIWKKKLHVLVQKNVDNYTIILILCIGVFFLKKINIKGA
ncbi:hypothetical protein ACJX0J_006627, partial [Zea mays]